MTAGRYAHLPPVVVASLPTLSDKAVRTAAGLGAFMGKTGECWPSLATLGAIIGTKRL